MFRHLRAELGVEVTKAPKKLPYVPTEAEIRAFYDAVWKARTGTPASHTPSHALNSLYPALAIAGAVALAGFGWRLRQRQSLRGALAGLLRRAGGDGDRGEAG